MSEWRMFDADGHVREAEREVFEYLPESYRKRRSPVHESHVLGRSGAASQSSYRLSGGGLRLAWPT